jgi:cysteine desulfuration protein SufE
MNDLSLDTFSNNEFGTSITLQEILDTFEFLDDWEDRYAYIIDLGKKLPPFPESEKTELNKVHGCQSQVWLINHYEKEADQLYLLLDSDALIVRGLAAIVLAVFNNKSPRDIVDTDIEAVFTELNLIRHISATRGNGLRSMVKKIQEQAQSLLP